MVYFALTHLRSKDDVQGLMVDVLSALESGGKLVITFRDLTHELTGMDRFIPVRSDADTVFTCFLEYEPETVKVHDLVYRQTNGEWEFTGSFYRKLRLSKEWVCEELASAGFANVEVNSESGLITLVATKSK